MPYKKSILLHRLGQFFGVRRGAQVAVADLGACSPLIPFDERVVQIRKRVDARHVEIFDGVMKRVDRAELERLQRAYRDEFDAAKPLQNEGSGAKYLDIPYWTADKLQRDYGRDLLHGPPLRILDIGCGGGHFGALCEELGHEYVGIDLAYDVADKVSAMLGLDRRIYRLEPQQTLPESIGRFDLVSALAIKFHHIDTSPGGEQILWTDEDWDFFLRDVTGNRMFYPGTLHLQVNQRKLPSGKKAPLGDVLDRFEAIGARVSWPRSEIWLDVDGKTGLK